MVFFYPIFRLIFTIGNHDNANGEGLEYLSNIDILNNVGHVNYFGKVRDMENINIEPILLTKGETKIALYGIGHINDSRLNLAMENKKLHFRRPLTDDDKIDDSYFNILVVHQNRFKGVFNGVPRRDSLADDCFENFDLVIWGHEHECIKETRYVEQTGVHIL